MEILVEPPHPAGWPFWGFMEATDHSRVGSFKSTKPSSAAAAKCHWFPSFELFRLQVNFFSSMSCIFIIFKNSVVVYACIFFLKDKKSASQIHWDCNLCSSAGWKMKNSHMHSLWWFHFCLHPVQHKLTCTVAVYQSATLLHLRIIHKAACTQMNCCFIGCKRNKSISSVTIRGLKFYSFTQTLSFAGSSKIFSLVRRPTVNIQTQKFSNVLHASSQSGGMGRRGENSSRSGVLTTLFCSLCCVSRHCNRQLVCLWAFHFPWWHGVLIPVSLNKFGKKWVETNWGTLFSR